MSDFLDTMATLSAERAATLDAARLSRSLANARPVTPLRPRTFGVIAEIKDRSPAEGELRVAAIGRRERAEQYQAGGAAAISVLTEPSRFEGRLAHLVEVANAVPDMPVMRKDFLVEPVQVVEARSAGASGVLLIATMLSDAKLCEMLDCAFELDLFCLLESFDAADLERVHALLERPAYRDRAEDARLLVGVNTRDLRTLEVDSNRLSALAGRLPAATCVAESGIATPADAAAAAADGYRLVLVGSALMRSDDPAALLAHMREAGTGRIAA